MRFLPGAIALASLLPVLVLRGASLMQLLFLVVPTSLAAVLSGRPQLRAQLLAQVGWWSTGATAWLSVELGPPAPALAHAIAVAGTLLAAGWTWPRLEAARVREARVPVAFEGTLTASPVVFGVVGWMLVAMGLDPSGSWLGVGVFAGAGALLLLAAVRTVELRTIGLLLAPLGPSLLLAAAFVHHALRPAAGGDLRPVAAIPLGLVLAAMLPLALARTDWRPAISRRVRTVGRALLIGLAITSSFAMALSLP